MSVGVEHVSDRDMHFLRSVRTSKIIFSPSYACENEMSAEYLMFIY